MGALDWNRVARNQEVLCLRSFICYVPLYPNRMRLGWRQEEC
jgi:hypothetical protein